jgi:hypothetical protein
MNSVYTAKNTQLFPVTKSKWLMLFKKIIHIYSQSYKTQKNEMKFLIVEAGNQ